MGTHLIALFTNGMVTYFDSFGVEYNPKEIKKFKGNRTIEIQQIFIENRLMIR